MPHNHQKEVKNMALIAIFMPIVIVIWAYFNPILFFPTLAYWCALATVCLGLWLYGFASYDLNCVLRNHRNLKGNGPVTTVTINYKDGRPSDFGLKIPFVTSSLVNPYELPKKIRYFGRWTVYHLESHRLHIWHDKYVFGDLWYYIQY